MFRFCEFFTCCVLFCLINVFKFQVNIIRGPFRPESNFAYTQRWYMYLAEVTLKTLKYFAVTSVWMMQANKNPKK